MTQVYQHALQVDACKKWQRSMFEANRIKQWHTPRVLCQVLKSITPKLRNSSWQSLMGVTERSHSCHRWNPSQGQWAGHSICMVNRYSLLQKLHIRHCGIEETKANIRTTVFWPGINKCIEAIRLNSKTSSDIIRCLNEIFSRHSCPQTLIADNIL